MDGSGSYRSGKELKKHDKRGVSKKKSRPEKQPEKHVRKSSGKNAKKEESGAPRLFPAGPAADHDYHGTYGVKICTG